MLVTFSGYLNGGLKQRWMDVHKISMPHTTADYKNETNEVSPAVNLKKWMQSLFIKLEEVRKPKNVQFKNDIMTDVSVESIIIKVNAYLRNYATRQVMNLLKNFNATRTTS